MSTKNNLRVIFEGAWQVAVREESLKVELGQREVLIETLYSVVSPGTELACLSGKESWFPFPRTPGYAQVGRVAAIGSEVKEWKTGELAVNYGGHQRYQVHNLENRGDFTLAVGDAAVAPELAAFTRMATIAFTGVRVSSIELGDSVAVLGMGVVGNLAAQLAQLAGGFVVAMDANDRRLEQARACGLANTLNPRAGDPAAELKRLSGGEGVRTVIDATGSPRAAVGALPWIAKDGELILLGSPRGECQGDLTDLLNYVHLAPRGCITLKGAHEWRYPLHRDPFVKHSLERNSQIVLRLLAEKRLDPRGLITHTVAPRQAPEVYAGLREKPEEYLGVVIDWPRS